MQIGKTKPLTVYNKQIKNKLNKRVGVMVEWR